MCFDHHKNPIAKFQASQEFNCQVFGHYKNLVSKNIKLHFFVKVIMWVFHGKDNEGIA
jgi:hypothetical protein